MNIKNQNQNENEDENKNELDSLLMKAAPWAAGAGIAVGHILTSSNCSIPKQGFCSSCGSCIVALGSLVAWAMIKKRQGNDFYSEGKNSEGKNSEGKNSEGKII